MSWRPVLRRIRTAAGEVGVSAGKGPSYRAGGARVSAEFQLRPETCSTSFRISEFQIGGPKLYYTETMCNRNCLGTTGGERGKPTPAIREKGDWGSKAPKTCFSNPQGLNLGAIFPCTNLHFSTSPAPICTVRRAPHHSARLDEPSPNLHVSSPAPICMF